MAAEVDWAGWPLLVVRADKASADEVPGTVSAALGEAISRGERFAAVVVMGDPGPRRSRVKDAVERVRMVKRLRPGLSAHCLGLAFVAPASVQKDNAKTLRSADKIWGCPTTSTDDPAQAETWALGRLAAAPERD